MNTGLLLIIILFIQRSNLHSMEVLKLIFALAMMHLVAWSSSNNQFVLGSKKYSFLLCIALGIVSSLISYAVTNNWYGKYTMWELRMITFSTSFLVFPFMTWKFFGENPFETKTQVSIALSFIMIGVQIFWK